MKCQLASTRLRGTPLVAPICEKPPTLIAGSPPSYVPTPVFKPIELGLKDWSCGKNPSANRFHPKRASFTWFELTTFTYESETNCTRVGVTVLKPGRMPADNCANGKL